VCVDRVRDRAVGAACLVLVDHRGAFAVMTHTGHQIAEPGSARRGEVVPGMKVQPLGSDGPDDVRPAGLLVEVSRDVADRPAGRGTPVLRLGSGIERMVLMQVRDDGRWDDTGKMVTSSDS
jgi:hypothetical protein